MDRLKRLMENNNGWPLRSRLLDGAPFRVALQYSAIPEVAASGTTATFTRATTKTWPNNDGYLVTGVAGEIGFVGARRVYNLCPTPSASVAIAANKTITATVGVYVVSMGAGTGTLTFTGTATGSTGTLVASASARNSAVLTITVAGTIIATASVATCVDIQFENVTAQTTQTAGDYVSVGALDYRSTNNPLYLSLPGTAGHYASTPDSVANSITGDIDIRVQCAAPDWTPAASADIITKFSAGQGSWIVRLTTAGIIVFFQSLDGTATTNVTSTAAVSFTNGTVGYIRITRASVSGEVKFYTSTNGTDWTQLGNTLASVAGSLFDGTAQVQISGYNGSGDFAGKIFSAQIYNGIGGTLAVDFNPQRDATTPTGTITSSTTGEVWTINGASSVVRSDFYHGSMVDGVKCFLTDISGNAIPASTMLGYSAEAAATNHFLQSGTPATQTSGSLSTGTYTFWMDGTGSIAVAGATATITGAGTATSSTSVTFVVTVAGTVTYTVTGSPTRAQAENTAARSSYIATTTVAVTRNADVLTYSGGDIANIKTLMAGFRREVGVSNAAAVVAVSNGLSTNYVETVLLSATSLRMDGASGGVTQWLQAASNAYVPGATGKAIQSWATNDVKMAFNGVAQTPDTSATVPVGIDRLDVGHINNSLHLNGVVAPVYGWTRNLSQSEEQAVTRT